MPYTRLDVAKRAGVSPTTVSRVLNNNGYVSEDVRERVLLAIKELEYVPNRIARSLRTQKVGQVACITHGLSNPFYAEIVQGIEEVVIENGYTFSIYSTSLQRENLFNLVYDGFYDGLIILTESEFIDVVDFQQVKERIPISVYGDFDNETSVPNVSVNLYEAMKKSVTYLLDSGHTEIVYLGYSKHGIDGVKENPRFNGYADTLSSNGVMLSSDHLLYVPNWQDTLSSGYNKVIELLNKNISFTAIAACNDLMAIGAIRALNERGIRVPEDVSVTGFDDVEIARMFNPALTTISLPNRLIGRSLMEILLQQLKGNTDVRSIEYVPELIIRESVKQIIS
ncbi:DNA-binding LacI/PurR family transcriptional regulator [Bacillus mesophilus]|uniref:LacI family transcriptional regulator n=1 Tax=Bacillus mesophilus TaxID=1808955 RepID=A0A6M0QE03_9BACI|nr:LacI family DNA-binding transcriptional regulator [Bacillus mesophilus]MBM7663166.1 DNA-binding LacI/PurR family transcriptional regulator [Bacillus mesophilus]NEY73860.1 LacI family transcriptional regulator [Bacillus mesophilus]